MKDKERVRGTDGKVVYKQRDKTGSSRGLTHTVDIDEQMRGGKRKRKSKISNSEYRWLCTLVHWVFETRHNS
jgi:hypothetical protein